MVGPTQGRSYAEDLASGTLDFQLRKGFLDERGPVLLPRSQGLRVGLLVVFLLERDAPVRRRVIREGLERQAQRLSLKF